MYPMCLKVLSESYDSLLLKDWPKDIPTLFALDRPLEYKSKILVWMLIQDEVLSIYNVFQLDYFALTLLIMTVNISLI